jgi:SET domain-containing protein
MALVKMKSKTDEFLFVLKPSEHGVGVFAVHDIKKGTFLRLFGDIKKLYNRSIKRKIKDVPQFFRSFCIYVEDGLIGPKAFGAMSVGWYLNHAKKSNAFHKNYDWYAARNIKAGEEILIDYNSLEEPEEKKENYYRK